MRKADLSARITTLLQRFARRPDGQWSRHGACNGVRHPAGCCAPALSKETCMLQMAAVFFVIAIIAAVFGFGGIAAGAVEIAKILFFVFLIMFIVTLVMGIMRG